MTEHRPARRIPVEERRAQILDAALREFSHKGLHGGSTMAIARQAGISQPNIFRIFATKRDLFVAVLQWVFRKIESTMLAAGESAASEPLTAMSDAWGQLMLERENMFMLLQGYAASDDPTIRDLMHEWTRDVFQRVEALPGVGEDASHEFFADGMLYMVATAMDLPARATDDPWAARFLDSGS